MSEHAVGLAAGTAKTGTRSTHPFDVIDGGLLPSGHTVLHIDCPACEALNAELQAAFEESARRGERIGSIPQLAYGQTLFQPFDETPQPAAPTFAQKLATGVDALKKLWKQIWRPRCLDCGTPVERPAFFCAKCEPAALEDQEFRP